MDKKNCPYCGEEILAIAKKCKHCGEWIEPKLAGTGNLNFTEQVTQSLSGLFEIQEEIGSGGMAVVYRAIQKSLNREVALKVLYMQHGADDEFLERFRREAEVSAGLKHPNIAQVYDVGEVNGINYLAMEYLDGANLGDVLGNKGKLNDAITGEIGQKISSALTYIHDLGLIHRDIKSSNIMLTKDSRVILTDFGIAYAIGKKKLSKRGDIFGTPEYMSPEQIKGDQELDGRTDIYSLGTVLYECLVGRVPYEGNSATVINKKLNEQVVLSSGEINEQLLSIVNKCLEKEPSDRFKNAYELNEQFNYFLGTSNEVKQIKKTQKIDKETIVINEAETDEIEIGEKTDLAEEGKKEENQSDNTETNASDVPLDHQEQTPEKEDEPEQKVQVEDQTLKPTKDNRKWLIVAIIAPLIVVIVVSWYFFIYNNTPNLPFETLNLRGEKLINISSQLSKINIPVYYHFVNKSGTEPGVITQPFVITRDEVENLQRLDIYIVNENINN